VQYKNVVIIIYINLSYILTLFYILTDAMIVLIKNRSETNITSKQLEDNREFIYFA